MLTNKQVKAQRVAKSIPLQPCESCNTIIDVHRHHDDYDFPLRVRFLCRSHHIRWHKHNKPLNRFDDLDILRYRLKLMMIQDRVETLQFMDNFTAQLKAPAIP